ncbi:MAG TPA: hypothetical protein VKQ09_05365, partial [Sphingomonas sp.]|nr:hypothetical protein [Sphingomonas sp.]
MASSLPVGSITGNGGVAGSGVGSNIGTPGQPSPLEPALVTAGNAVLGTSGGPVGSATNTLGTAVPTVQPVTSALNQTLVNTGNALVNGGTGKAPLVDGLTSAVSPLVTVSAGNTATVGGTGTSLVAIGAGAGQTGNGSLVDLHLATTTPVPGASNLPVPSLPVVGNVLGGSGSGSTPAVPAVGSV